MCSLWGTQLIFVYYFKKRVFKGFKNNEHVDETSFLSQIFRSSDEVDFF
jgi:hypothetical protein